MDRNFTRRNSSQEPKIETGSMRTILFGPREETLEFICQFARVYQFEPKLAQGICSFIIN
jgi:hypothetical protein